MRTQQGQALFWICLTGILNKETQNPHTYFNSTSEQKEGSQEGPHI